VFREHDQRLSQMRGLPFSAGFLAATAAVLVQASAQAPGDTLESVLARAGAYAIDFQRQLSGIVAEERYVQDVHVQLSANGRFLAIPSVSHRELASDFLLVKPIGADRYVEFRDVFEVDGMPVRDRSDRLTKLFLEANRSTADQIEHIVADSTRYNIGNIRRTVNVPVLPLMFLDPVNQYRFRFTRTHDETPPLALKVPSGAWIVRYEEVRKGTMIRTTNARDLPAHGRFWIEPLSGRVLMSELIAEDFSIRGAIAVSYQSEPIVGLLVPGEMRERYDLRRENSRVDGIATYSRFRQFQVTVDEKLAPVVKQ
jgi:hypothetical protein